MYRGLTSLPALVAEDHAALQRKNPQTWTPARQRHPPTPLLCSLRITSSPRRNISTSSVSKRNSFGRRTAWLFPDLNTRAVPMSEVYTEGIYGRSACPNGLVGGVVFVRRAVHVGDVGGGADDRNVGVVELSRNRWFGRCKSGRPRQHRSYAAPRHRRCRSDRPCKCRSSPRWCWC